MELNTPVRRTRPPVAEPSLTEVVEAVVGNVMVGLSITAVRGSPGTGRAAGLNAVAARLGAYGLRVVVLANDNAISPAAVLAALLATVSEDSATSLEEPSLDRLVRLLALPAMQELVLLVDGADSLPAEAYRFMSLLLRLTRNGNSKVRFVLFGADVPWPELHRVRQDLWSTHALPSSAHIVALRGKRRKAPVWALPGLSIVIGCAGVLFLLGREAETSYPFRPPAEALSLPAPEVLARQPVPVLPTSPVPVQPTPASVPSPMPSDLEPTTSVRASPPLLPDPASVSSDLEPVASERASPLPSPVPASVPTSLRRPPHGLVFMARPGDTLAALYIRFYRGQPMPPFSEVLAMNPAPVRPGSLVMFPEPPSGWSTHEPGTPGSGNALPIR